MEILALDERFRGAVDGYVRCLWGGPMCVTNGVLYDTSALPGFVAVDEGALLGALIFRESDGEMEVSALFSLVEGQGVGRKLLGGTGGGPPPGRKAALAGHHQRQHRRHPLLPAVRLFAERSANLRGERGPEAQAFHPAARKRRHPHRARVRV